MNASLSLLGSSSHPFIFCGVCHIRVSIQCMNDDTLVLYLCTDNVKHENSWENVTIVAGISGTSTDWILDGLIWVSLRTIFVSF